MAAPITGQVAITGSAQRVDPANTAGGTAPCTAFTFKTPSTNANIVYIGPAGVTTTTGYPLTPGDEFEYQRQYNTIQPTLQLTPNDFFAVGTAGSVLAWFATP